MGIFTPMNNFLNNLKDKNYQNKKVGIIENGTWAPNSGKCMKEILSSMKNIEIVEPVVTIRSTLKEENIEQLKMLADDILKG
jgi:flavorubredoxin